jgi:folate-binding protein YgfZ
MVDACFVLLEDRGVLAISGADRRAFLQGLVSNDVDKVGPGQARYAALLTAQGKYLHDFLMVEGSESILLDAEAQRLADLKRRLLIYRLRAKVAIDGRPDLAVASVFGDGALEALGFPAEPGIAQAFATGIALVDPRMAALGARCILPHESARSTLIGAGFAEVGFTAYDHLRLGLGVPDGSRDLVLEKSILLEAGFDELNGVDWEKGCYIGQELTARTKYRGLIKRRLVPVAVDGPAPSFGTIVTADGHDVGEMRSSNGETGLALLRIEAVLGNKRLVAGDAVIVPRIAAWMRFDGNGLS